MLNFCFWVELPADLVLDPIISSSASLVKAVEVDCEAVQAELSDSKRKCEECGVGDIVELRLYYSDTEQLSRLKEFELQMIHVSFDPNLALPLKHHVKEPVAGCPVVGSVLVPRATRMEINKRNIPRYIPEDELPVVLRESSNFSRFLVEPGQDIGKLRRKTLTESHSLDFRSIHNLVRSVPVHNEQCSFRCGCRLWLLLSPVIKGLLDGVKHDFFGLLLIEWLFLPQVSFRWHQVRFIFSRI